MKVVKFIPYEKALYRWKEPSISSSTLFGAVSNAWVLFYGDGELDSFFDAYDRGEILFSSIFPMIIQEGRDVLFYPKPLLFPSVEVERRFVERFGDRLKKLKRVKFLSEELFFDLINSVEFKDGDIFYTRSLIDEEVDISGYFAFYRKELKDDIENLFSFLEMPHVSVDRLNRSNEGRLFFSSELAVSDGLGFFFFCRCDGDWGKRLIPLFKLLADEGVGGKRSTGRGLFMDVKVEEKKLPDVKKTGFYILLSRVFPSPADAKKIYTLSIEKDDGFVYYSRGRSLKKSAIYLLKEGSVTREKIGGCLLKESGDELKVVRNGKAFLIGSDAVC